MYKTIHNIPTPSKSCDKRPTGERGLDKHCLKHLDFKMLFLPLKPIEKTFNLTMLTTLDKVTL